DMRRPLVALVLGSLLGLALSGGVAGASGPQQNVAAGTGQLAPFGTVSGTMVHVNAQSDFGGANPRGHFYIREPAPPQGRGFDVAGAIVCLTVAGNSAGMTGRIDRVKVANSALGFEIGNYV